MKMVSVVVGLVMVVLLVVVEDISSYDDEDDVGAGWPRYGGAVDDSDCHTRLMMVVVVVMLDPRCITYKSSYYLLNY